MEAWKFASYIEENKEYKVEGLNIWNHDWVCSERKIEVFGPRTGNPYLFNQYEIRTPEKTINFVAGEFSDELMGLYMKEGNELQNPS